MKIRTIHSAEGGLERSADKSLAGGIGGGRRECAMRLRPPATELYGNSYRKDKEAVDGRARPGCFGRCLFRRRRDGIRRQEPFRIQRRHAPHAG